MYRALVLGVVLLSCLCSVPAIGHDDTDKNYVDEKVWVSVVVGSGGNVDIELGRFSSLEGAEACSLKWSKAHPNDLRLTDERERTIRKYGPAKIKPKPEASAPTVNPKPFISNGARGLIVVRVYEIVNGKSVEVPSRRYETASDYDSASQYYANVNSSGARASWNAPGWPGPKIPIQNQQLEQRLAAVRDEIASINQAQAKLKQLWASYNADEDKMALVRQATIKHNNWLMNEWRCPNGESWEGCRCGAAFRLRSDMLSRISALQARGRALDARKSQLKSYEASLKSRIEAATIALEKQ